MNWLTVRNAVLTIGGSLMISACTAPPEPHRYPRYEPMPTPAPVYEPPVTSAVDPENGTLLEQLQTARQALESEQGVTADLKTQVTSMSHTLTQVKEDNTSLQDLVDSFQSSHNASSSEVGHLQTRVRELEMQLREQIDQVLTERIQRLRVERELILAKIAEGDRIDDA